MSAEGRNAPFAEGVGPTGPIPESPGPQVVDLQNRFEEFLARGETPDLQVLRDYRDSRYERLIRDRPFFSLAWPANWYIPSDADYSKYWFTAPPAGNRYTNGWAQSQLHPASTILRGSPSTGSVFVFTGLLPSDTHDSTFAGVGAVFRPSATLSYADVSIDAEVEANSRIWMLLARDPYNIPTVHIRCTAYVCVWDIDPVTGAWKLMRPFGRRTLVNRSESGVGGSPIRLDSGHFTGNALSTRVQVQGGHSYGIGFHAQVDVDLDVREDRTRPYQLRDGDDWKLWADMNCSVSRITTATTVLIR